MSLDFSLQWWEPMLYVSDFHVLIKMKQCPPAFSGSRLARPFAL